MKHFPDRRCLLRQSGLGLGALALGMMEANTVRAADPLAAKVSGHRPRAQAYPPVHEWRPIPYRFFRS